MPSLNIACGYQATLGFSDSTDLLTTATPPIAVCTQSLTIIRDFGGSPATAVTEIKADLFAAQGPFTVLVEYSNDGVTWTTESATVTFTPI